MRVNGEGCRVEGEGMKEEVYRGTSLTKKQTRPGPYRRPVPRVLGESKRGGSHLMGEVLLYAPLRTPTPVWGSRCGVQGSGFRIWGFKQSARAHTHTYTHLLRVQGVG